MNDTIKEIVDILEMLTDDDQQLIRAIARRLAATQNNSNEHPNDWNHATDSKQIDPSVTWEDLAKRVKGIRK